jgi:hypothetical protein
MILRNWSKKLFAPPDSRRWQSHFAERIFGQSAFASLVYRIPLIMLLPFARRAAICFCWGLFLVIPSALFAQTNYYGTNGTEYAIIGSLLGDQVFPDAAVTTNGGFVVWEDNATDGSGLGVSARKVDSTLSGTLSTFRVNAQGTNDQENPRVALLKNNGAAFAWQGGKKGYQHIFARLLTPTNTWMTTTDIVVSTFTNHYQINPAMAVLSDSNIVVVWGSLDQASSNSLQDVYCQILSPVGQKIGTNFLINQFTTYNQRTPSVAALKNGGFVVTWISEQQQVVASSIDNTFFATGGAASVSTNESAIVASQSTNYLVSSTVVPSVDIYARLYASNGVAAGGEFLVDTNFTFPCANPDVASGSDGGFTVVWDAHDMINPNNSLDIYARSFSSAGAGGATVRVNTTVYGDQYAPRISSIGTDYLVVWTSLGQDGSREGVYGQFLHNSGAVGGEFRVNTTTVSQQMQPVVASDGANQFVTIWTSYTGSPYNFDLFAQRYMNAAALLSPMSAPFVYAPFTLSGGIYQPQLQVAWPVLLGISVSNFEVYADGATTPTAVVTSNQWTMTAANGLTASSTHSFTVDYVTTDDRRSPLSTSASGTTWSGKNWGGIPYEWMTNYFGSNTNLWPAATADSDGDGVNNLQEFLSGTNPTNAASVLRVQITGTAQGMYINWSTQPGLTYQVQVTTNLTTWSNLGAARFAAGTGDSIFVGNGSAGYYRVVLQR